MRRLQLRDLHKELGASFGEFAGWEAPIDFGSVVEEHLAVRKSVGIFDVSHMGKLVVKGSGAHRLLDHLVPRVLKAEPGEMAGPTAFLNEAAGFVDDIMLYRLDEHEWGLVVNAVNTLKDLEWLENWASKLGVEAEVIDRTEDWVLLAIQGPRAVELMKALGAPSHVLELPTLKFVRGATLAGAHTILVSRSGWTGEDGFEVLVEPAEAEKILKAAVELGARPCGLGARDSLRVEMGFPLYGREIDEETNPVEARYWWVLRPGPKSEFLGRDALLSALRRGASRVRVGIKLAKGVRVVPRHGDKVYVEGVEVGYVTSGCFSPVLGRGLAQAYVKSSHALMGLEVEVERGKRRVAGKIVDFPFVRPSSQPAGVRWA